MITIELTNGYYIEVDELNHTLKQRYTGKTKDGTEKEGIRLKGYYGNLQHALEGFIRHNQIDSMADFKGDLEEYVKTIDEINKRAVQALEMVLTGSEDADA